MKKQLLLGTLLGTILLYTVLPTYAGEYKVYNPRTNKAYTVILGTSSSIYYKYPMYKFSLEDGGTYSDFCVLDKGTNVRNGLIGGQCTDYNAFIKYVNKEISYSNLSNYKMGWREYKSGTYAEDIKYFSEAGRKDYGEEVRFLSPELEF